MEYIVTNENLAYLNKKLVAKFDESSKQMIAIMPSEIGERSSPQTPPLNYEYGIIREHQVPLEEELSDDENSSDDEMPIND